MTATSTEQRTASSWAFLKRPPFLFKKVLSRSQRLIGGSRTTQAIHGAVAVVLDRLDLNLPSSHGCELDTRSERNTTRGSRVGETRESGQSEKRLDMPVAPGWNKRQLEWSRARQFSWTGSQDEESCNSSSLELGKSRWGLHSGRQREGGWESNKGGSNNRDGESVCVDVIRSRNREGCKDRRNTEQ